MTGRPENNDDMIPEMVIVDGSTIQDVCWLVDAVEEFARFGDIEQVHGLLQFANPSLSANGLAAIARGMAGVLHRRYERAAR